MDLRADFLIIGSGIAGLRAAVGAGRRRRCPRSSPRPSPTRATPATRRAASPRRSARTIRPDLHAADTHRRRRRPVRRARRARARRGRAALRARADRLGRARSIATPTGSPRWPSRGRTACGACCTRATRPAARSAACSGSACRRMPRVSAHRARSRRRARSSRTAAASARASWPTTARVGVATARPMLLATGGAGQVFARRRIRRSRPATASRWPIAPAPRVADLEFVQFHPTALDVPGRRGFCCRRRCAAKARGW